VVSELLAGGRSDVRIAANLRGAAIAGAAADGALHQAIFRALDPSQQGWPADGAPHRIALPGARAVVRIVDQGGLINPNTASDQLLSALLQKVGADARTARALGAAIADWRFPSAEPRAFGAKAPQYRAAGRAYGPPGAPFESRDELRLVLGMTPALYARLRSHLSVWWEGAPDPALADPTVARALAAVGAGSPGVQPVRVVAITAAATASGGARFVRRAVVRLDPTGRTGLFRILTWRQG
jgi:general secretion pathway protein K